MWRHVEMNSERRVCFLETLASETKSRIRLAHGVPLAIGRSPLTGIQDPLVSRRQVVLTADCNNCVVSIERLGTNPSGLNGFALKKGSEVVVEAGAHLEILLNKYTYVVKFETSQVKQTTLDDRKRKADDTAVNVSKSARNDQQDTCSPCLLGEIDTESESTEDTFEKVENGHLYIFTTKGVKSSNKIAAYDMDWTLIKTKSGNKFPKDVDDWQILFPEVPAVLKQYQKSGYKIVIFTNQATIGNGKMKPENFKTKLENVLKRIGIPAQVFISIGKGSYRKPATGMWDTLCEKKNGSIKINYNESFYCGDAAGRKGDHSFSDKLFSDNIGIKFFTPEMHFKRASQPVYGKPPFDPKCIDKKYKNPEIDINKKQILVMVGFPGCGKSTLSKQLEKKSKGNYKIFCRDIIGSWQKCVSEAEKFIQIGKSIIVDSTNLDADSRSRWLLLAKKYGLSCNCISFDVTILHCKHNNLFRQFTDKNHSIVTDMIFNMHKKKFKEPELSEGFNEIIKYKFIPEFDNKSDENLYFKCYLDK